MFNSLFAEERGKLEAEKVAEPALNDGAGDASTSTATNPLLNFWSVATAVTNTVKARADELVKSVVDTDWRTELSQFSREVGEESKTLKEKTAELVEHLPEQVVHLPEKAEEALHHLPAQVHLPKDVGQTLEDVSVAFTQFGKSLLQGTKELIDELKEGVETEISAASREGKRAARGKSASSATAKLSSVTAKYNRFEAEVAAMQRDSSTYCDEPEDGEDYARWKAGFSINGVKADIARILSDNAFMAELQSRLVPIIVEYDDFWHRYFYRLYKLQQKEEQRQQLAQRAKTLQEDDVPLGWGDEDEVQPSPRAPDGHGPSGATESNVQTPEMASTGGAASKEGITKPADPTDASTPTPQSRADSKASVSSYAAAKDVKAVEPASVVMRPVAVTAIAASTMTVESVAGGRKSLSGDGASASGSIGGCTSVVDGGHGEGEPHAETASDSSAKEWCVVSSDAQQAPSPSKSVAVTGILANTAKQESSEIPHEPPAGDAFEEAARQPETDPPVASVETVTTEGKPMRTDKAPGAEQGAQGAKRAAADRLEEEIDEDWGNWD